MSPLATALCNGFSATWNWLVVSNAPVEKGDGGIAAVAAVAVVIWTGGFVLRAMRPNAGPQNVDLLVALMWGMDFLQTAFMCSLFALVAGPHALRLAALGYLGLYLSSEFRIIRAAKSGPPPTLPTGMAGKDLRKRYVLNVAAMATKMRLGPYVFMKSTLHLPFFLIFAFPQFIWVAVVCWFWTLRGMWWLCEFLYLEVAIFNFSTNSPAATSGSTATTPGSEILANLEVRFLEIFARIFGSQVELLRAFALTGSPKPLAEIGAFYRITLTRGNAVTLDAWIGYLIAQGLVVQEFPGPDIHFGITPFGRAFVSYLEAGAFPARPW